MKRSPPCFGWFAALSLGAVSACGQGPEATRSADVPAREASPPSESATAPTPASTTNRDTTLREAKAAIEASDYARASTLLTPLVEADDADAEAHYNLGLVAHREGRYNQARSGYLAALRARPAFPDARYNLAILTWNCNVKTEARHHVARFLEQWPSDPRAKKLLEMTGPAR